MQSHSWLCPEFQVFEPQIRHFLDAATGVVQQQQKCSITEGEAALGRQVMKQRLDLVPIEEAGFGRRDSFARNGGNLLGNRETLGQASPQKFKERMQHGEPVVACSPMIVAVVFEMLKEPQDAVECKRIDGNLREPTRHISRDKAEKKPQSIPMRLDGGRPEAFLKREFVGEECMKQGAKRGKRGRTHVVTL
jgi:hypothetical protein